MLSYGCRHAAAPEIAISIIPLGAMREQDLTQAKQAIEKTFRARVAIAAETPLPKNAYYAPRNRYRADKIDAFLANTEAHGAKVIGLTAVDISTTHRGAQDWGVLGLADGDAAVVSLYRMKGQKASASLIEERLRKTVLHELGHTFGLDHCANVKCVMQDGDGGITPTDRAEESFCDACRATLGSVLREDVSA
jgi:archaemetzincin